MRKSRHKICAQTITNSHSNFIRTAKEVRIKLRLLRLWDSNSTSCTIMLSIQLYWHYYWTSLPTPHAITIIRNITHSKSMSTLLRQHLRNNLMPSRQQELYNSDVYYNCHLQIIFHLFFQDKQNVFDENDQVFMEGSSITFQETRTSCIANLRQRFSGNPWIEEWMMSTLDPATHRQ